MSTEDRSSGLSPVTDGRLNLEQQRKRAKELLKAAKAGEREALERFVRQLGPSAEAPKLVDAQRVIALENGFLSWSRLKHHIEAVAFAQRNMGLMGDRDMRTLHVRCGSDIRQPLKTAGFTGDFLEFSDPFCVGPLPALPLPAHIEGRARFIAGASFGMDGADALARLQGEYEAVGSLGDYQRIVLWFEHDSYDQLILAYLLKRLGESALTARIELIAVGEVPGVERFVGLGQLSPDVLCWIWERRVPIGEEQFRLGAQVWDALTAPSPEPLHRIAHRETPAVPLMAPALMRHLRELPDLRSGLGLTERLILEIVQESGPLTLGRAFGELTRHREPLPFLGDTMFRWVAGGIAGGDAPLLRIEDAPDDEPWFRGMMRLTPAGARVLAGDLNWLDLAPGQRWVGGVAIPGEGGSWCWDEQTEGPVWRAD